MFLILFSCFSSTQLKLDLIYPSLSQLAYQGLGG